MKLLTLTNEQIAQNVFGNICESHRTFLEICESNMLKIFFQEFPKITLILLCILCLHYVPKLIVLYY